MTLLVKDPSLGSSVAVVVYEPDLSSHPVMMGSSPVFSVSVHITFWVGGARIT